MTKERPFCDTENQLSDGLQFGYEIYTFVLGVEKRKFYTFESGVSMFLSFITRRTTYRVECGVR